MQRGQAIRTVETLSSPQMWSLSYKSGTLLRKFRGKQMLLFSLKCKRPWIKSSALLLSGVKEPGRDKGDPEDDKSGCGWKPIAFFLSADSYFPKTTSQSPVKRKLWFCLLPVIRIISCAFQPCTKVRKKIMIQDFLVDKDYVVGVCDD